MPRHSDPAHASFCRIGITPISCSLRAAVWRCMHVWALAAIASCGGGQHRPAVIGEYLFRALDTTPTANSSSNCKRLKREKTKRDHKVALRLQSPSKTVWRRAHTLEQPSMHAGSARASVRAVRTTAAPVVADRRRHILQAERQKWAVFMTALGVVGARACAASQRLRGQRETPQWVLIGAGMLDIFGCYGSNGGSGQGVVGVVEPVL